MIEKAQKKLFSLRVGEFSTTLNYNLLTWVLLGLILVLVALENHKIKIKTVNAFLMQCLDDHSRQVIDED